MADDRRDALKPGDVSRVWREMLDSGKPTWEQWKPVKVTTDYGVTSTAGEAGIVAEIFDRLGLKLK